MFGQVPISSLKLNASLYLYSISMMCFLNLTDKIFLSLHISLVFPYLTYFSFHHLDLTTDTYPLFLPFLFNVLLT